MSFFSSLWLNSSALVFIIVFIVIRFYWQVSHYPKGPLPYPVIGNMTYLNTLTNSINPHHTLSQLHLKYGPVFTIWMSHKPFVFIADPHLVKEAFQMPEFSDRGFKYIEKAFTLDRGNDIVFNDYNRIFIDQKKLLLTAIRKYLMTDNLDKLTIECVDEFWDEIKSQGLEKPIEMPKCLYLIVAKVVTRSLYETNYKLDDPEFKCLINAIKKIPRVANLMVAFDGLSNSMAQLLLNLFINTSYLGVREVNRVMVTKYREHLESYKNGRISDVVDALIAAKEETVREDRESTANLDDVNMVNIIADFLVSSIDTTSPVLEWIFLLMVKHPEMQSKMQREIRQVIGDQLPKQEDRKNCHFTVAFINETLRLQPPAPVAAAHQTKTDVEIGGHKIPGQTIVVSYLYSIHRSENFWTKPDQFDPTRFLDVDGKMKTIKQPGFMPFSIGRRSCPGEKLAQFNLFLIVARMLQLTDQMGLELTSDGPIKVNADPSAIVVLKPVNYKLMLKRRPDQ